VLTKEVLIGELDAAARVCEIADRHGLPVGHVYSLACEWGIDMEFARVDREGSPPPDEIKARAAEVRSRWTPSEEQSRMNPCYRTKRWRAPSFDRDDIMAASSAKTK
jgi:hypothetical protein